MQARMFVYVQVNSSVESVNSLFDTKTCVTIVSRLRKSKASNEISLEHTVRGRIVRW